MRAAQIEFGIVVNIILVASLDAIPGMELVEARDAEIGDSWDGENFHKPAPGNAATVVPERVTRRQGIQALRLRGVTEAMVEVEINKIADEMTRDLALIEFRTSTSFERYRPLVISIGTTLGFDLDELFLFASTL